MTIRPFTKEDFEKTVPLFTELDTLHLQNQQDLKPDILDMRKRKDYLFSLLDKPGYILLVAEEGTEISGFVLGELRRIENHVALKDSVYGTISDLVVKSTFRKKGTGQALLKAAEDELKAKGALHMELKVYSFNENAIRFYTHVGYASKMMTLEKKI